MSNFMETNKIISLRYQLVIGYVLLVFGLVLIGWTLWQSYDIFTGKVSAPLVFMTPVTANSSVKSPGLFDISGQIQNQLQSALGQQVSQLISADSITKFLNLASWLLLAWIFIMAGGAISGIGVKLLNGTK